MPTFALVDGNNFYASCQMAFDPSLWKRPVVVLSNNDGCIVSANHLAKALNEKIVHSLGEGGYRASVPDNMMFQPYFKVKDLLKKHNTAVFSSNYELYADMSSRMHQIIGNFAPEQEIYSIDESFLNLTGFESDQDFTELAWTIKNTVFQWLSLPVAVGIGSTKTLAKLANHLAKKHEDFGGVLSMDKIDTVTQNQLFKQIDVGEVWGIGKNLSVSLKSSGIFSVYDLKTAPIKVMRKRYSIQLERIIRELNGEACFLKSSSPHSQQVISSRSFGTPVMDYKSMEQAMIFHTANAARKLRSSHKICQFITVYMQTNKHKKTQKQYKASQTIALPFPSNNTIFLAKYAKQALQKIWKDGLLYKKAGVAFSDVHEFRTVQDDFFNEGFDQALGYKNQCLMQLTDTLNKKMGNHTIYLLSEGIRDKPKWTMRRELMSKRYTTRWDELLKIS